MTHGVSELVESVARARTFGIEETDDAKKATAAKEAVTNIVGLRRRAPAKCVVGIMVSFKSSGKRMCDPQGKGEFEAAEDGK